MDPTDRPACHRCRRQMPADQFHEVDGRAECLDRKKCDRVNATRYLRTAIPKNRNTDRPFWRP